MANLESLARLSSRLQDRNPGPFYRVTFRDCYKRLFFVPREVNRFLLLLQIVFPFLFPPAVFKCAENTEGRQRRHAQKDPDPRVAWFLRFREERGRRLRQ